MESNFFNNPIVIISLAILLFPLTLKILEQMLPVIQEHINKSFSVLSNWMRRTFHWSGQLVTAEGQLSLTHTVAQNAGAVTMIAFFAVFTVCELQFTWATLCPMFGGTCSGEAFAGSDRLLAYSTILLATEFGLIIADLLGGTYTTHFARIQRARSFFLSVAVLCCLLSITVGGVMAWYRDLILGMNQPDVAVMETNASIRDFQTIILVLLAVLLFIGALFAFLSVDTFFSTVLAGLAAVSGMGLALVYLLLRVLDLLMAVVLVVVKIVRDSLAALTEGFHRQTGSAKTRGQTVLTKLQGLVAPRETSQAAAKAKSESNTNLTSAQAVNMETQPIEKQAKEQLVNGYEVPA